MPDRNSHEEPKNNETKEKRQFIKETIVKPPRTRRQMAARAIALLFSAAFFGIIAAVTFAITAPFARRYLTDETTESPTVTVTIPTDSETLPPEPETTVPQSEEGLPAEEDLEELIRSEIESYQFNENDLKALFNNLRTNAEEAGHGIVTVNAVKHQTDWFNNPVETAGQYSGVVIATTPLEYLILTPIEAVSGADSIMVTTEGNEMVSGQLIGSDSVAGLAVIGIQMADLSQEALADMTVLELGNSHTVRQGDLLTAIGSPAGYPRSFGYGMVSYIRRNVQVTDGISRLFYVDAPGNAEKGTFLIDMDGRIVGWTTNDYQPEGDSRVTAVRAISDYKPILEKLSNGIQAPYFGIMGQEVTEQQIEQGLPAGIYVTRSIDDSPAYQAGIQAGDIITELGGNPVSSMAEWNEQLDALEVGQTINVRVERYGREEYTELEYPVIIGAR